MSWVEDRWTITVKNTDGSTTQKPSSRHGTGKRWRVRYETPDGRERSLSFARKPPAERFRTQVDADLLRGTYLDPDAGKITLRKYATQWLADRSIDDTSRESTQTRLAHILAALGDKRLDQLAESPSAIQSWVNGLKLAPATKGACLALLSSIFAAAVDDRKVARNPCRARSVKTPPPPKRKVVPLEADAVAALRAALPPRYQAMADAGTGCGLRQSEIFGLSAEDIGFLRRTVHVRCQVKIVAGRMVFALPKGGKTRDVPLSDATAVAFAEHIRTFPPASVTLPWHEPGTRNHGKPKTLPLMFSTPRAHRPPLRQRFNAGVWKPALRKAGIPGTRENGMHVLRHTYASVLLSQGVDIRVLAECLGHTDPGFTLRVYTHLMKGSEESVRRALDAAAAVQSPAQGRTEAK